MGTLAERIDECLKESGHTVATLARQVGVKGPSVYDWLNGRTKRLSGMNLIRTADFFGVSVNWLDSGEMPKRELAISRETNVAIKPSQQAGRSKATQSEVEQIAKLLSDYNEMSNGDRELLLKIAARMSHGKR